MNQMVTPPIGQRDGDWVWDGTRWVCCPESSQPCLPVPCPPFGPPVFSGPAGQPPWYPGANGGVSFGQDFPANPVRGHFFWNGTALYLFDGAAWNLIGGGSAPGGGGVVTPPGSTFPTSPVPGQQFFDGNTLWIWSGSAWIPVGPGAGGISNPNIYSVTTFTSPGNFSFTIPQDVVSTTVFKFHLQGGGGGGGGCPAAAPFSAQGGGGGEYKQFSLIGAAKGLLVSCTVPIGGLGGPAAGGPPGQNGGDASVIIANTNTTIIARGGYGGWGAGTSGTNNSTEGTGGRNGTFSAGSSQAQLVLSVPGGDAHLPSPQDWGNPGGSSFMGEGQPGFDATTGWADTTLARGYGAGGRGAFNDGSTGGSGIQGVMIIERING